VIDLAKPRLKKAWPQSAAEQHAAIRREKNQKPRAMRPHHDAGGDRGQSELRSPRRPRIRPEAQNVRRNGTTRWRECTGQTNG